MSEPFIGEITMFAGDFAPRNWAFCNGQLLPINQYTALFSILGTTYGGDGRTNFALPNLQARIPIGVGGSGGISNKILGERGGESNVTLTQNNIPPHTHNLNKSDYISSQRTDSPSGAFLGKGDTEGHKQYAENDNMGKLMDPVGISHAGGSQSHNNIQPYLTINFIIAMQGIYPSRP